MRLIDADELKEHTVKVRFSNAPECGEFDAVVVYEIDIAPTVATESPQPTAHWNIKETDRRGVILSWECDKCGRLSRNDYPYCPWCGKRMVNTDDYCSYGESKED